MPFVEKLAPGVGRDWAGGLRKIAERDQEGADSEAMIAWREFLQAFRRGEFDVTVRLRGQTYIFADKDAIDRFIRR